MRAKEACRAVPSGAGSLGAVVTRHVAHNFVAAAAVVPGLTIPPIDPATGSVNSFRTHRVVPVFEAGGEFRLGETKSSLRACCLLWGTCRAKVSRRAVLAFNCRFKVLVLPAFARNASLLPNIRLVRSLRAWRSFLHSGCRAMMAFWAVPLCHRSSGTMRARAARNLCGGVCAKRSCRTRRLRCGSRGAI